MCIRDSFGAAQPIYSTFNNSEVLFRKKRLTNSEEILTSIVKKIDNIASQFDGSKKSFPIAVEGENLVVNENQLLITLNGIIQAPGTSYSVVGNNLVFAEPPKPDLHLTDLQFWNGFDTGLTVVEKNLIFNMEFEVMTRTQGIMKGAYLFTIDNYHPHRNEPDFYFAESPDEHKSHNIIELDNGQICAYPNNRCRMTDPSLTNHDLKTPDFKVSTRYFNVEHVPNGED